MLSVIEQVSFRWWGGVGDPFWAGGMSSKMLCMCIFHIPLLTVVRPYKQTCEAHRYVCTYFCPLESTVGAPYADFLFLICFIFFFC